MQWVLRLYHYYHDLLDILGLNLSLMPRTFVSRSTSCHAVKVMLVTCSRG